jgi:hypothetical protein
MSRSALQKDVSFVVDRNNAGDQPAVVEFDGELVAIELLAPRQRGFAVQVIAQ